MLNRPSVPTVDISDPRRALRLLAMPVAIFALGVTLTLSATPVTASVTDAPSVLDGPTCAPGV